MPWERRKEANANRGVTAPSHKRSSQLIAFGFSLSVCVCLCARADGAMKAVHLGLAS